jgi:hypothetical protein
MKTIILGAVLGCAGIIGAGAAVANTIVTDFGLTATAGGESIVRFDLDGDTFDDYEIEIEREFLVTNGEDADPTILTTPYRETATIRGLANDGKLGGILIDPSFVEFATLGVSAFGLEDFARAFQSGETIGGEGPAFLASSGILYEDFYGFSAPGVVGETPTTSRGSFSAPGFSGYLGLSIRIPDSDPFFGWLEITRGSITVGQGAISTTPGAAIATPAAVPLPPGLALFAGAFGLMGFAARRRRS